MVEIGGGRALGRGLLEAEDADAGGVLAAADVVGQGALVDDGFAGFARGVD